MMHQLGFIGLGKMGKLMVTLLRGKGIDVVAYNRTPLNDPAFPTVLSIDELSKKLVPPRVIWLMIPNGKPIDEVLEQLIAAGVTSGDTIIDGGNTFYKDTVTRATMLKEKGIRYIDSGTSGGLDGAANGASLMLGGEESIVTELSWLWDAMAVKDGWAYFGPSGAGHFVKMVHNGIEYGEVEALGEGVEIISKSPYHIDLAKVAKTWSHGSIIRGYLVDLLARALEKDPTISGFTGRVGGGETGGWALAAAREFGVDASVLGQALAARQKSQNTPTTTSKVVSALRREYGGHKEAQ